MYLDWLCRLTLFGLAMGTDIKSGARPERVKKVVTCCIVMWALSSAMMSSLHNSIHQPKLRALVYDILPSTTAVFSYDIESRKLSANEQFFVSAQTVVIKFLTNDSNKTRRAVYSRQQSLHQHK